MATSSYIKGKILRPCCLRPTPVALEWGLKYAFAQAQISMHPGTSAPLPSCIPLPDQKGGEGNMRCPGFKSGNWKDPRWRKEKVHAPSWETTEDHERERMEKDRKGQKHPPPLYSCLHLRPRLKDSHVLGLLRVSGNSQCQGLPLTCAHMGILLLGHGRWVGGTWTRALGQLYTGRGHHLTREVVTRSHITRGPSKPVFLLLSHTGTRCPSPLSL